MNRKATFQAQPAGRAMAPAREPGPQIGEDLSDWLKEAASRPWVESSPSVIPAVIPESGSNAAAGLRLHRLHGNRRDLIALVALTIAYLQYYYLDVMVQVASLPKVIVFVAV
jgi:hypothetical protein